MASSLSVNLYAIIAGRCCDGFLIPIPEGDVVAGATIGFAAIEPKPPATAPVTAATLPPFDPSAFPDSEDAPVRDIHFALCACSGQNPPPPLPLGSPDFMQPTCL